MPLLKGFLESSMRCSNSFSSKSNGIDFQFFKTIKLGQELTVCDLKWQKKLRQEIMSETSLLH